MPAKAPPVRIPFAAFGVQFVRQVFTPARLARQMAAQLPPPLNGYAPVQEGSAFGHVKYSAAVRPPQVAAATDRIGWLRVTLPIDMTVTLNLGVLNKTFNLRAHVPFWMVVETYKPLVVFLNVTEVQRTEVVVTPTETPSGWLTSKIWEAVSAQLKVSLADEVNKSLRGSYSSRVIDLLKTVGGMSASAATDALGAATADLAADGGAVDWDAALARFAALAPDTAADVSTADHTPAEAAPTDAPLSAAHAATPPAPDEAAWLDGYSSAPTDGFGALAAERVSYEFFGGALLYHLASPQVIAKQLNTALQKNPLPAQVKNELLAFAMVAPSLGQASVRYEGQTPDEQRMRAVLRLRLTVSVYALHVWREGWEVDVEIALPMLVRTYDAPLLVYVATPPIVGAQIAFASRQTTTTGFTWGQVESNVRDEIVKAVNEALPKSNGDRTREIEAEVRAALKE